MAYQSIRVPRFFINTAEWLSTVHRDVFYSDFFKTLPVNPKEHTSSLGNFQAISSLGVGNAFYSNNFIAILGHDLNTQQAPLGITINGDSYWADSTPQINFGAGNATIPEYDGFTIGALAPNDMIDEIVITASANIGSIIVGNYYEMEHSPNLSLTQSIEYDGIKEFTTHNGASMSNAMWNSVPRWGRLGAWELWTLFENPSGQYDFLGSHDPWIDHSVSRSGRRIWQLSFSFLSKDDLWGSNQSLYINRYDLDDGIDADDIGADTTNYRYNLIIDDNFFSQVWHKTLGGTLPFIFQPNKDDNTNFAIARFRNKSLKATQSAPGLYDISVTIEETW